MKETSYTIQSKNYNESVLLAKKWVSHYPSLKNLFPDTDIETIQAFPQFLLFSSLILKKNQLKGVNSVLDTWSTYPTQTNINKAKIISRFSSTILSFFKPKHQLPKLSKVDVLILSSGRHLTDLEGLIFYLNKKFNVLVVGKTDQQTIKKFSLKGVNFIKLENGFGSLSRLERFTFVSKSLNIALKPKSLSPKYIFESQEWKSRLMFLKLILFPEIFALIKLARKIIGQSRPSVILTSSSNDIFGATFCVVAREMKVVTGEIQHGYRTFSVDSPFFTADYQLVWGEIVKKLNAKYAKRSVTVGSPQLKRLTKGKGKHRSKDFKILVLWTPSFDTTQSFEKLDKDRVLGDLMAGLLNMPSKYKFHIRSHPSLILDLNKYSSFKRVSMDECVDIYESIIKHDLIITFPTTAGLIACELKKPLLFIDNSWVSEKYQDPLFSTGAALRIDMRKLKDIGPVIEKFLHDKNLLTKQQENQGRLIKSYVDSFGEESYAKIAKFINKHRQ